MNHNQFARILVCFSLISTLSASFVNAVLVNLDFEGTSNSTTHSAGDGTLSTGGTTWNGIDDVAPDPGALLDEFGNATALNVTLLGVDNGAITGLGHGNNLQDEATYTGFLIYGFGSTESIDFAVYMDGGFNGVEITHAGGTSTYTSQFDDPTGTLPGVDNRDYFLSSHGDVGGPLTPYQVDPNTGFASVTSGIYGIGFGIDGTLDGGIGGVQITHTPVPEPETYSIIFACFIGLLTIINRRRKS